MSNTSTEEIRDAQENSALSDLDLIVVEGASGTFYTGRELAEKFPELWNQICISERKDPRNYTDEEYDLQDCPEFQPYFSKPVHVYWNFRLTQMVIATIPERIEERPILRFKNPPRNEMAIIRIATPHRNTDGRFTNSRDTGGLDFHHGKILYTNFDYKFYHKKN